MEGDGDLVAAAIMAMQQTETDHAPETNILQVVDHTECPDPGSGDGPVENQIVVQSENGEIIVQQQTATALHGLQLQQSQNGLQLQAAMQHGQDSAMTTGAAVMDSKAMGVEIQNVNVIEMHTAEPQSCCVTEADGTTTMHHAMPIGQVTPLDVVQVVAEVNLESVDDDVAKLAQNYLSEVKEPLEQGVQAPTLEVIQEETQETLESIDENVVKLAKKYLSDVKEVDKDYLRGFHEGPRIAFEEFLSKYFCMTGTSFVAVSNRSRTIRSTGHQRQSRYYGKCEGRIRWEAKGGTIPIEFCGFPFKIEGSMYLHCLHGPKRDLRTQEIKPPKVSRRGRPRKSSNKKLECPAAIQVREISMYVNEGYFVDKKAFKNRSKLRGEKQRILKKIRDDESKGREVNTSRRLYIKLPFVRVHSSLHAVGENSSVNQTMDNRVSQKLKQLIANNVTNINDIKKCLKQYVDDVLFKHNPMEKPKAGNRRFYPSPMVLQRHVATALSNKAEDTDVLAEKIKEWQSKGDAMFMYRPRGTGTEESFLFLYQAKWQQRLLERYGSDLVMMDATSKSNTVLSVSTPMYSLCIHTNVNFIIVAIFIVEKESVANIKEALSVIHSWNPWWNPSSFMVGKCNYEISAVKELLPNARIYISDYHRRQAIARWIGRKESGLDAEQQKTVRDQMDRIAAEQNQNLFNRAKKGLLSSKIVKENEEFLEYLKSEWFSCPEGWAHAFRDYAIDNLINVNNGEMAMDRFFRYSGIPRTREKGVDGMVTLIIESYLPDSFNKYRKKNNVWKYNKFPTAAQSVPDYLRDRPAHFVKECLQNQEEAGKYSRNDIHLINAGHGVFNVQSKQGFHITSFLGPSCTCSYWKQFRFPCKHFFAIFMHFYDWGFHQLPELYISSVFLTRDAAVFQDSARDGTGVVQDFKPLEIQVRISEPEAFPSELTGASSEAGASFNPSVSHQIPVNLIPFPDIDDSTATANQEVQPEPDKQVKLLNIFKRGMDLITEICNEELISETEQVMSSMVTKLQRQATHEHYMQNALPSLKRIKLNPPLEESPVQLASEQLDQQAQVPQPSEQQESPQEQDTLETDSYW